MLTRMKDGTGHAKQEDNADPQRREREIGKTKRK
jgi:hypothetical protein